MKSISLFDIINSIGSIKIKTIKTIDLIFGTLITALLKSKPKSLNIPNPPNKILVIRPGGIGDAIFLLPLLRAIKEKISGLKIDILCEKRNVEVFKSQPDLCEKIFCYDKFCSFKQLISKKYDVVIDTEQWHYLSALVAYFIKSRLNVGFATRPLRLKLFNIGIPYDENAYELDNFRNLFISVFLTINNVPTIVDSFKIDQQTIDWAKAQLNTNCVALFLGASIPLRRLTPKQTLDIIKSLIEQSYSVALLGGKDIMHTGQEIKSIINNPQVQNFIGKASLIETAALIKCSQFFIGPDSGIMHLACAVATPVTAIFGPGNVKKWGPQGDKDKIISLDVECSPCTRFGYTVPTCHRNFYCMKKIAFGEADLKRNSQKFSSF